MTLIVRKRVLLESAANVPNALNVAAIEQVGSDGSIEDGSFGTVLQAIISISALATFFREVSL